MDGTPKERSYLHLFWFQDWRVLNAQAWCSMITEKFEKQNKWQSLLSLIKTD